MVAKKMKLIQLAWTRDFTLAWAQWWSTSANPELLKVIGVGVNNQLSYFNGILLETYRLQEETESFLHGAMNLGSENSFFAEAKIKDYIAEVKEIRTLIKNMDITNFFKVKELSIQMYPWYTISYLLPQEKWAKIFLVKDSKNKVIIERLIQARKQSEGVIGELCEYWRAVARQLLEKRKIAPKYNGVVTFREMEKMLESSNYSPNKKELSLRIKAYIYFPDQVYTGIGRSEFFAQHDFYYPEEKVEVNTFVLKGNCACSGKKIIRGQVQIILHKDQVNSFQEGNILVTVMTTPLFLPALKKAVALITDEGGITCHAAITAREFNLPCLIGTKIATHVFKDGDIVEVDTIKGIVRKVKA